jgi:hypothetical protein
MKINIVSRDNGVGLSRDAALVTEIAEQQGHDVTFNDFATKSIDPSRRYDLNIFLELLNTRWFPKATLNWMIPNPEWFDPRWKTFGSRFNAVLCKTKTAMKNFAFHSKTQYISFTSQDRYLPRVPKDYSQWLHVAGRSLQKSTDIVYSTWAMNPHFPHLTIIQHPDKQKPRLPLPNVTYRYEVLPDEELQQLQNECGVHVCPSETEGFGHYIAEGLSCQAVVLTTSAPPMNELVTPDRGILCDFAYRGRQRLATTYFVSEDTLAEGVRRTVETPNSQKAALGERGRAHYLENDAFFRQTFADLLIKSTKHAKHRPDSMLAARRLPRRYP